MTDDDWKPNLFVPGFPKCASTALYEYLRQHPDIYMLGRKEPFTLYDWEYLPRWMLGDRPPEKLERLALSENAYRKHFSRNTDKTVRGECSTFYTFRPDFAEKLKEFSSDAKTIVMVRDARKKLLSTYFYHYEYHEKGLTEWTENYLKPDIESFLYLDTVKAYKRQFGDNFRVIDSSSLATPQETLNDVFDFLDVPRIAVEEIHANVGMVTSQDTREQMDRVSYGKKICAKLGRILHGAMVLTGVRETKIGFRLESDLSPTRLMRKFVIPASRSEEEDDGHEEMLSELSEEFLEKLDRDYERTLEFCREKDVLIGGG